MISAKEGQEHDRGFAVGLQAKNVGRKPRTNPSLRTDGLCANDDKNDGSAIRDCVPLIQILR